MWMHERQKLKAALSSAIFRRAIRLYHDLAQKAPFSGAEPVFRNVQNLSLSLDDGTGKPGARRTPSHCPGLTD